jgi:aryl-alcohol dehydrogenase-like predicted oxidoreductase
LPVGYIDTRGIQHSAFAIDNRQSTIGNREAGATLTAGQFSAALLQSTIGNRQSTIGNREAGATLTAGQFSAGLLQSTIGNRQSAIDNRQWQGGISMNYRKFGRMGWMVSELGYGMWGMGGWTGSNDDESKQALERSVELGCNFFDTAWAYGEGHSEALLGWLARNNPGRKLYTATKVPPKNFKWPSRREYTLDDCFPPQHIEDYVQRSLKNAGLESFDLVQFHVWEDSWVGDDRWVRKVDDLRRQGLIHALGISINRWEPWNGVRAVQSGLIDAVQVIYNIFDQNPEDELFPACAANHVAVIARVPFDEGTLTGTLTLDSKWPQGDWRNSYFVPDNLKASVARAEALRPLVPGGMAMPEMALRFILNNPTVSTIIPGMRRVEHVEANAAACHAGPLPDELFAKLRPHRWDRKPTPWSQ